MSLTAVPFKRPKPPEDEYDAVRLLEDALAEAKSSKEDGNPLRSVLVVMEAVDGDGFDRWWNQWGHDTNAELVTVLEQTKLHLQLQMLGLLE